MRPIGFSTGAVAYSQFRQALELLGSTTCTAVELSALRADELKPLVESIPTLHLDKMLTCLCSFAQPLRELHVSEVNTESKHDPISLEAQRSFEVIAPLIPRNAPVILESRVAEPGEALGEVVRHKVEHEMRIVRMLLGSEAEMAAG